MDSPTKHRLVQSIVFGFLSVQIGAYPAKNEVFKYFSRPDLSPPRWEISIFDKSRVNPGYIFFTPFTVPIDSNLAGAGERAGGDLGKLENIEEQEVQNGPYIFSSEGELVYSGWGAAGGEYNHDLKPIMYRGSQYMTFFQGDDSGSGNNGNGVIMDTSYHIVKSVQAGDGRAPNDVHEFTLLPGGTALTTIFQATRYDLSVFGISEPWGWVTQGIFQEIDITTGNVLFEWRSLDHVDPSQSFNVGPNYATGSNGSNLANSWDYFHLNSVEKDPEGNYLISSRYSCAIFKICAADGSIIWHLGGKKNDFTFKNFNGSTPFAFQHHARYRSHDATANKAVISLFDNGSDGAVTNNTYSSGMLVELDFNDMSATLLHQFFLPGNISSTSQGSVQYLDIRDIDGTSLTPGASSNYVDANVFISWGSNPFLSEYTSDGTCVFKAQYAAEDLLVESYRAFKGSWIGRPDSRPAIFTYSNSSSIGSNESYNTTIGGINSPTRFYISWNGATEITSWKFYGGSAPNKMRLIGEKKKIGFETTFDARRFLQWGYAEAFDRAGRSLGQSITQETFLANISAQGATNGTFGFNATKI